MNALPVAGYLEELTPGAGRAGGSRGGPDRGRAGSREEDAAAALEAAYARGIDEGGSAARAEFEAQLKSQLADFEHHLRSERERWTLEQSERLSGLLLSGLRDLETTIAGTVARILKPVLLSEVYRRAVADLAEALGAVRAKGDVVSIVISGPNDLLEALRERLGDGIAGLSFVPAEGAELRIVADQTILETRIGAWVQVIEGANV